MNNITITSAQYVANPMTGTNTCIKAVIDGQELFVPLDPANRHYRELVEQGTEIAPYVEPAPTAEQVRAERDRLLAESDWTQITDAPVDQAAWAVYRQALRDVPQQAGFPHDVVWPTEPE